MMVLAVVVGQLTEVLPIVEVYTNETTVVILGLVLGEISKALNTKAK